MNKDNKEEKEFCLKKLEKRYALVILFCCVMINVLILIMDESSMWIYVCAFFMAAGIDAIVLIIFDLYKLNRIFAGHKNEVVLNNSWLFWIVPFMAVVCSILSEVMLLILKNIITCVYDYISGLRFVYLNVLVSVCISIFIIKLFENREDTTNNHDKNNLIHFRECTNDYIKLKSEQYLSVAHDIKEIIDRTEMDNTEGTYEIVKKWIVNNELLGKRTMLKEFVYYVLENACIYAKNIVMVVISIFTALISVGQGINVYAIYVAIICAIILGMIESIYKLLKNKLEKLNIRILKDMDYKSYESLLKSKSYKKY